MTKHKTEKEFCKACGGIGILGFQRETCWFCNGTGKVSKELNNMIKR